MDYVVEVNGLMCDDECKDGCWGPGNTQCIRCRNSRYKDHCVANCNSQKLFSLPGTLECRDCHPECNNSCIGPVSIMTIEAYTMISISLQAICHIYTYD